MRKMIVLLGLLVVGVTHSDLSLAGPPIAIDMIQRTEPVNFEKEILPILQKNCLACHSAHQSKSAALRPEHVHPGFGDGQCQKCHSGTTP